MRQAITWRMFIFSLFINFFYLYCSSLSLVTPAQAAPVNPAALDASIKTQIQRIAQTKNQLFTLDPYTRSQQLVAKANQLANILDQLQSSTSSLSHESFRRIQLSNQERSQLLTEAVAILELIYFCESDQLILKRLLRGLNFATLVAILAHRYNEYQNLISNSASTSILFDGALLLTVFSSTYFLKSQAGHELDPFWNALQAKLAIPSLIAQDHIRSLKWLSQQLLMSYDTSFIFSNRVPDPAFLNRYAQAEQLRCENLLQK